MQGKKEILPEWTPFRLMAVTPEERAHAENGALEKMVAEGLDRDAVIRQMEDMRSTDTYINSRYLVHLYRIRPSHDKELAPKIRESIPDMVHLHVKRRDFKPSGPEHFRDLQRIKNELVGPNTEAVELYPAERRLIDTGNSYHLWVIDDQEFEFPFGFSGGRMVMGGKAKERGTPLEQEPFEIEPEVEPTDPEAPRREPMVDQLHPHRHAPGKERE